MIPKDPKVSKSDLTSHGTSMNNLSSLFVCIWQLGRTSCSMPRAILDCWTPIIFHLSLRGRMLQRIANIRSLPVTTPKSWWCLIPETSPFLVKWIKCWTNKNLWTKKQLRCCFHLAKKTNSSELAEKDQKKSISPRTPSVITKILGVILLCKSTARCQAHAAQRPKEETLLEEWQTVYNLGNRKRDVKQGGPRKSS